MTVLARHFQTFCRALTFVGMVLACGIPLLMILICAFCQFDATHLIQWHFTTANFQWMTQSLVLQLLWHSLWMGTKITLICLSIAYLVALAIQQLPKRWRLRALTAVVIPFWTSTLIRTYAILALLKAKGILSQWLMQIGWLHAPLNIAFTPTAAMVGLVYNLLPFMLIPITLQLNDLSPQWYDAARDLGANTWQRFTRITLPLSRSGVVLGCVFVWLPAVSVFYIPSILGGAQTYLIGNLIADSFIQGQWPRGAALCLLLLLPVALLTSYRGFHQKGLE